MENVHPPSIPHGVLVALGSISGQTILELE
jgi:hypothetical protein